MKSITLNDSVRGFSVAIALFVAVVCAVSMPISANAQEFGDGCCDYFGTVSPADDYYGTASPAYDYYGTASPSSNYDYYGTASPASDYYGTATPENSYTPGYTDTPIYSNTPGYTDTPIYSDTPGYTDTPMYSSMPGYSDTPFYSSMPNYGSQGAYYGSAPSFSSASPFAPAPFVSAPSSAPSITSQHQTQSQSSYNSNPNTNTNYTPSISSASATNANTNTFNPTNTNTNTNNPTAVATNGPITNTNNASTGPINIQNTVNVVPAPAGHNIQYTLPTPSCTIYAGSGPSYSTGYGYNYNNSYNYNNQPVTLSWSSQNATSAYITPNVGTVAPSGSTTVYPYGYTTYTMTISGPGGTATCQTSANYAPVAVPSYIAPPVYTQPAAPVVSLTQIPYTGFDYGPVGNAIYWMSMFAFAAAAGYLLVYFRGGAMNFASSLVGSRSSGSEMQNSFETEEMDETPVSNSQTEEIAAPVYAFELPSIERSRITTDSMIIDQSEGAPRIVIART